MREIKYSKTWNFSYNIKTISKTLICKSALKKVPNILTINSHVWIVHNSFLEIRAKYGLYGFCPALNEENSLKIRAKLDLNCLENYACNLTRFLYLYGMYWWLYSLVDSIQWMLHEFIGNRAFKLSWWSVSHKTEISFKI